ncbi:CtpF protein [Rhodobacteraceae bacterium RKSG542]|uniref:AAA family ATPase n=1 Tax=Pseudovibrio flavus TaxID=2529854 RepID=UPI0012BB6AB4|nr:AAA family ATPase [Pseudovibrio flavus]MTI17175.1 CtpF protein [Pseudovibrio flavus]
MSEYAYSLDQHSGENENNLAPYKYLPVPRISIQAFCFSGDTKDMIEAAALDRRMNKAHTKVMMGGVSAAIAFYETAPTPNLLVLESDMSTQELMEALDKLSEVCDSGTKVLIIGRINDVNLYRELISFGISEYLVGPVGIQDFISNISHLYCEPNADPLGRIIAVIGARGGCGASTIAHNISWAISKGMDSDVALADLDLPFGTVGLDFNQDPLQGVAEAIAVPERLDEILLDRLYFKSNDRLSLLTAPASLDRTYDFNEDQFDTLVEVMRKGTPNVILDVPHSWNGWTKRILATVDDVIIVAEPDLANLRNAKNIVDTLLQLRPNDKKPFLLLNKTGLPKRPEIKPEEFVSALQVNALPPIPFDGQTFGTAANNGQMIGEHSPKHQITQLFDEVASVVLGRREGKLTKFSLLGPLLAKLTRKKAG